MTDQRSSSEDRYAHLRANAAAQKQATVDRLSQAIATLEAEGRPVNTFTIKEVSGLDYMAYYRNVEALSLFRKHSTHLRQEREKEQAKRRRSRAKHSRHEEVLHDVQVASRDRLLNYKKPELVAKLRATRTELDQMEQRYHALLQEHMHCGVTIARLEAQLAEHLAFMDRFRSSLRQEEYGQKE
jgi:uncharacterized coiled-coil protein SlyX